MRITLRANAIGYKIRAPDAGLPYANNFYGVVHGLVVPGFVWARRAMAFIATWAPRVARCWARGLYCDAAPLLRRM